MAKSIKNKNVNLLRLVEEGASSKKTQEEKRKQQEILVPYLPKDCITNILIRLPLESLQRARFVCKPWYNIINNAKFIDSHLCRSETVLIFLIERRSSFSSSMSSSPPEKPNSISVENKLLQSKPLPFFEQRYPASSFSVQFREFNGENSEIGEYNLRCMGNIRATCNGLILLDNKMKKGGLIVMNPVTRKMSTLPPGTLFPPHMESYAFALSNVTGEYKVVHLFRDNLGHVSCEILNLGMKFWREINGPSFGLFGWFGYSPVSAIGALHWIPQIDHSDYIISMEVDMEKFHQVPLPKCCRTYDRIVELGGCLSFITHHEEVSQIDIWILKSLFGEVWTLQHSITVGTILDMVPLCSLRIKGDVVFMRDEDRSFYIYDFELQEMKKVELVKGDVPLSASYLPHINSLVSWCSSDGAQYMED
ncbi:F-box protein CPR1 [Ziziphus jujuba]|uniref:F-box protein CPR1 n=1 Tax=Ziziphus jujuba TaxID=326968 RepID=A0A6P4ADD2_ZIZJJ|nr:F-box protein CPR1 [Ziziphus jujuba]XP_048332579.2 F-box protein CPR1 [Ziziphus jujuba]